MAQITIADTTPRVQYTVGSTPTKGPHTIPFVYFEEADIKVYFNSVLKTLTTDYTITGTAVDDGFSGGTVLTQANQNGITITIERDIAIARTTDFPTSGIFNIATLNTVLDKLFAISQWLETKSLRTVQRDATSTETYSLKWPSGATTTPGVVVASSDAGIEISTVNPADIATASNAAAASAAAAVVSKNASASSATAAASSATASASSATASAASYDLFDDRFLGAKSSDPSVDNDGNTLVDGAMYWDTSNNILKIYDLGGTAWKRTTPTDADQAKINTVSANNSNINTVAGISSNVTTVAGISANVTTVANDGSDIGTVAGISSNVTAVGNIANNVTVVAGIASNVTTVAGISGNVTTAANNSADITNFASVYLGPASSNPSTRVGGSSLQEGDLYFNTSDDNMLVRTGSAWVVAYASVGGAMLGANNLSDVSNASTARSNLGVVIGTNVLAPNGNGSNLTGINTDPQLGFKNVSSWANNAVESVALNPAASAIGKASVKVWEEFPQAGLTNGSWNIATGDTGFSRTNTAYSQTLTPAATTGDAIAFTLGSGNWASTDIGKIITNTSASENGVARIKSVSSGVATCKITTTFTNTDAIASGDWSLSMIEFVDNAAVLASVGGGGPVAGTEKQVYTGESSSMWTVNLTATKAVQVWVGGGGIWGSILTIAADDTITTVPASNTRYRLTSDTSITGIYAVALNATTVVIGYNDISNSQYFTMMAFTVSGTTITQGSPTVVGNIDMGAELVIARMSNTHGIAFVKDDTNTDISAYGFSVSGTSITQGGRVAISTTTSDTIDCSSLSASKAVGFWVVSGVTYMRTINLSGTTASTGGAQATIGSGIHAANGSCRLTSTKILFVSHPGKAYVITENGSGGLSAGAPLTFGETVSGGRGDVNCCRMSDTEAAIFFVSSNGPVLQLVDIGSTTATLKGSPLILSADGTGPITGQFLSTNRLIAGYRLGSSPHGPNARVISISSPQFVTGQHACTISGSDSVDTTFYVDLNSVTVTETLNSKLANYAFSVNSTPSAQEVTGGSFFIIGDGETSVRTIASSLAAVTGGNAGVWHYNTNTSYGGATWSAAATNEAKAAIQQAETIAKNRMTGTAVNNVSDANWPALGTQFSVAITLFTDADTASPTVGGVAFNYDGSIINRDKTHAYTIEMPSTSVVQVKAPSSGNARNARIYVSK